jgi:hypothetical protein
MNDFLSSLIVNFENDVARVSLRVNSAMAYFLRGVVRQLNPPLTKAYRMSATFLLLFLVVQSAEVGGPAVYKQPDEDTTRIGEFVFENAMNGLSKWVGWTSDQQPGSSGHTAPSNGNPYLWVRLSKAFLSRHIERAVDREKPARDQILGITFVGTSRTTGQTTLVLRPSENEALGEVLFEGKIESQTTGHSGPATLHYLSRSTFRARKPLGISKAGLQTSPALATAPTQLTPTSISTSLPRLRGRIAQRIAWRRAAQSQSQANAIASNHRARDIQEGLDKRLNESLNEIQSQFEAGIANLELGNKDGLVVLRSRSRPDFVELALYRPGTEADGKSMPKFEVVGNPDIAVRAHRNVVAQLMADPRLAATFPSLPKQILQIRADQPTGETEAAVTTNLSVQGEWIALDIANTEALTTGLRVAAEDNPQQIK